MRLALLLLALMAVAHGRRLDATCNLEKNTDYHGGDLPPNDGSSHSTRVVAVATPNECCDACTKDTECAAFTWTPAEHCTYLGAGVPGCCFKKYSNGIEVRATVNYTSGRVPGRSNPKPNTVNPCVESSYQNNTDLLGSDIVSDAAYLDTVVAAGSASDCCYQCAAHNGCGAWTMTDGIYNCTSRIRASGVQGVATNCCFLKKSSGWKVEPKAGSVSGPVFLPTPYPNTSPTPLAT